MKSNVLTKRIDQTRQKMEDACLKGGCGAALELSQQMGTLIYYHALISTGRFGRRRLHARRPACRFSRVI
ncbi:hypothetical protein [Beduinella massiliensis]|uniref:hypothetical protein n=1 Tax=Beduinella massiliensis TaxID=1852363 RepID=UPI000C85E2EE